ncbi:hypothetical protein [Comamonas testosteroni]|uniref:hypothetical protein n=1 Tax=Comamonas testosteroni TaxID=285 RepID=UPI0028E9DC12|nr:hypothetical protein [Comamonas testosteroni]
MNYLQVVQEIVRTPTFLGDADPKLSQVFYLPCCFLRQWEEEGDHHGHDWQDSADASPRQEDEAGDIEGHGPVEEHGGQVAG